MIERRRRVDGYVLAVKTAAPYTALLSLLDNLGVDRDERRRYLRVMKTADPYTALLSLLNNLGVDRDERRRDLRVVKTADPYTAHCRC